MRVMARGRSPISRIGIGARSASPGRLPSSPADHSQIAARLHLQIVNARKGCVNPHLSPHPKAQCRSRVESNASPCAAPVMVMNGLWTNGKVYANSEVRVERGKEGRVVRTPQPLSDGLEDTGTGTWTLDAHKCSRRMLVHVSGSACVRWCPGRGRA